MLAPHQRVIGGMELDRVDAVAARIVRPQPGRVDVGEAAEIEPLARAPGLAEGREAAPDRDRTP